jgi:hypothetical protein
MGVAFDEYMNRPSRLHMVNRRGEPDPRGCSGTLEDLVRYAHQLRSGDDPPFGMILLVEGDRPMSVAEMEAFYAAPNFPKRTLQ